MDSSATTTDSLLKVLAWLDKNRKRVALITGGVVVALAIIAGMIYYQSQKEGWASEALSNVRKPYNPATAPSPDLAQAYLKVARAMTSATRHHGPLSAAVRDSTV